MPKDMKARQLIKQVPPVGAQFNFEGTDTITILPNIASSGWEVVQPFANSNLYLVWRGYIDLAGYTKDDLTLFTQVVDIQRGPLDLANGLLSSVVIDLVTTRRISNEEIGMYQGFLPAASQPTLDLQEIIYGEWFNRVPYDTPFPSLRNTAGDTMGTGNPTASDRLHITRIAASFGAGVADTLYLAGCNFIIGGVTAHEKDLVYIERLRRAYTQQRSEP